MEKRNEIFKLISEFELSVLGSLKYISSEYQQIIEYNYFKIQLIIKPINYEIKPLQI